MEWQRTCSNRTSPWQPDAAIMTASHQLGLSRDSISEDLIESLCLFFSCGISNNIDGSGDTLIRDCIPRPSKEGGGGGGGGE